VLFNNALLTTMVIYVKCDKMFTYSKVERIMEKVVTYFRIKVEGVRKSNSTTRIASVRMKFEQGTLEYVSYTLPLQLTCLVQQRKMFWCKTETI